MHTKFKLYITNLLYLVLIIGCTSTLNKNMVSNASCISERISEFKSDSNNFLVHTEYFHNYNCQQPPPLPYHDSFVIAQKKIMQDTRSQDIRVILISCDWPSYSQNPFHASTKEEHYRKCDSVDAVNNIIGHCANKYYNHLKDSLDYNPELDYIDPVSDAQKEKSILFMKLFKTRDSLLREEMKQLGNWTKLK